MKRWQFAVCRTEARNKSQNVGYMYSRTAEE
jgi:hypothetical protein